MNGQALLTYWPEAEVDKRYPSIEIRRRGARSTLEEIRGATPRVQLSGLELPPEEGENDALQEGLES